MHELRLIPSTFDYIRHNLTLHDDSIDVIDSQPDLCYCKSKYIKISNEISKYIIIIYYHHNVSFKISNEYNLFTYKWNKIFLFAIFSSSNCSELFLFMRLLPNTTQKLMVAGDHFCRTMHQITLFSTQLRTIRVNWTLMSMVRVESLIDHHRA